MGRELSTRRNAAYGPAWRVTGVTVLIVAAAVGIPQAFDGLVWRGEYIVMGPIELIVGFWVGRSFPAWRAVVVGALVGSGVAGVAAASQTQPAAIAYSLAMSVCFVAPGYLLGSARHAPARSRARRARVVVGGAAVTTIGILLVGFLWLMSQMRLY